MTKDNKANQDPVPAREAAAPGPLQSSPRRLVWRIAVTVAVINVIYANSYLGNPMSKSMLDLTVSIVDRGRLDIDPYAYHGTDISKRDGHFYSGMPPGVSLVCVPYYVVAKAWLWAVATPERERLFDEMYFAGAVPTLTSEKHLTVVLLNLFICVFGCSILAGVMAVLFHRALGLLYPDMAERRRLVTTWLFSFGTIWFVYSPAIYHRVLSTFLCFGAFLLVLLPAGERPSVRWRGLLFGLVLGLAVATTYEIAIVVTVLGVYALVLWRGRWAWGWTIVGAAVSLGLLAAYHTVCFGAPWITPYSMRIDVSVPPPLFQEAGGGVQAAPSDIHGSLSPPRRAFDFLFGSRYGVFFYSPLLLLALPGVRRLGRRNRYGGPAAVAFGVFLLLLAFHYVSGYHGLPGEFGFRMMLPAIPFLMLLVPLSYSWSYRFVVPALALLSGVIVGKGVLYGVHAGRPLWGNYIDLIRCYGFSNYTLTNLKDHLWLDFPPWLISAIHIAALAAVGFVLWQLVWRKGPNGTQPAAD
jgi:hypothetical protein